MFTRSYPLRNGGIPITGNQDTDLEAQFSRGVGRYPVESEIPQLIGPWAEMNYGDFVAYVAAHFPREAPTTAAAAGSPGSSTALPIGILVAVALYFVFFKAD